LITERSESDKYSDCQRKIKELRNAGIGFRTKIQSSKILDKSLSSYKLIKKFKNSKNLTMSVKKLKRAKVDKILNSSFSQKTSDKKEKTLKVEADIFTNKLFRFTIERERISQLNNVFLEIEQFRNPIKEIKKFLNDNPDKVDQVRANLDEIYASKNLKQITDKLIQSMSDCTNSSSKLKSKISVVLINSKDLEQTLIEKIRLSIYKLDKKFMKVMNRLKIELKSNEIQSIFKPSKCVNRRQSNQIYNYNNILTEQPLNSIAKLDNTESKQCDKNKVKSSKFNLMGDYTEGVIESKLTKKTSQNIPISRIVLGADTTFEKSFGNYKAPLLLENEDVNHTIDIF
jgi:hypothetical protein